MVVAIESKTFNNHSSFERGLWRRKTGQAAGVPQTSLCGITLRSAERTKRLFEPKLNRERPEKIRKVAIGALSADCGEWPVSHELRTTNGHEQSRQNSAVCASQGTFVLPTIAISVSSLNYRWK
jgi:hypothetical protein